MASSRQAGYNLIEISVVVLLLALFAALVTPSLVAALRGQEERSFRQDLRALVRTASAEAAMGQRTVTLRADGQALLLTLDEVGEDGIEQTSVVRQVPLVQGMAMDTTVQSGQLVSQEEFGIRFFPDGSAESGGIQFVTTTGEFYLVVRNAPVRAEVELGAMPEPEPESWEAGEIETRITGF